MGFRKSFWKPAVVGLMAVISGGWLLQQTGDRSNVYLQLRLFQDVVRIISDRYVDPVEQSDLYDMAVDGLLEELGDPHSTLLRPEDYSELRLQTTGNYGGLGIRIDSKDGWITVVSTLPKTPAERAGLKSGDRITEVDGKSSRGWKPDDAVRVLRGEKGTAVEIKVSRVGVPEPIPFRIVRDDIHVEYTSGFMYNRDVGYIKLSQFSEKSADDIKGLVDRLSRQGMNGLILDLRGNPGGLLEEGVAVSDLFLEQKDEVVATRSRIADQNRTYDAALDPINPDLPLVVLVDGFSASASEIVAGALQDHDRALVVGMPTFGKGSVQTLYQLPGGNYLKLTTAKWYTPSGRSIQREFDENGARLATSRTGHDPAITMDGQAATGSPDTTVREVFYTDAGRTVYGGGGITPDLIVQEDTMTIAEQEFRAALGDELSQYNDLVFRLAVEYAADRPNLGAGFDVTSGMLGRLYDRMVGEGIEIDRSLFEGAKRLIVHEFGIQLATVALDEDTALRRRLTLDRQAELAASLLGEGRTQADLFRLAEARRTDAESAVVGVR